MGQDKLRGIGAGRSHRHLDAADRDANLRADLQELQPDRAAGRCSQSGAGEAEAAERTDGVFGLSPISRDDAMKVLRFELMVNVVCTGTATSIRKGSAA
jgi:hypothetical protein